MINWLKENWKWLLIIPAIFIVLLWMVKHILFFFRRSGPDLTEVERKMRKDEKKLNESEKKKLEEVDKEKDKLKDGVDRGDPKASEVFNEELKK